MNKSHFADPLTPWRVGNILTYKCHGHWKVIKIYCSPECLISGVQVGDLSSTYMGSDQRQLNLCVRGCVKLQNYKSRCRVHARTGKVILSHNATDCSGIYLIMLTGNCSVCEDYETRASSLEEFGPARMQVLTLNLHLITVSFSTVLINHCNLVRDKSCTVCWDYIYPHPPTKFIKRHP